MVVDDEHRNGMVKVVRVTDRGIRFYEVGQSRVQTRLGLTTA